jgi:ferritin-like metal-binding protein YciE
VASNTKEIDMAADDIREQIVKYLTDVHSTEENAATQLRTGADSVNDEQLAQVLREHLRETEEHERLVRARLEALDAGPSKLKDVAQKGVAAVGGALAGAAPDTTGKVAIQAFTTENLEIASYRTLRAVAHQAGDSETVALAERILTEERAAAQKLDGLLERAALVGFPQSAAA